ncbi:peptide chain release factor N(5)-glutamine methyltransferase [Faecalimonas sp.]
MTLEEAYCNGKRILEENKIKNSAIDAWILLEHITKVNRALYYANPRKKLKEEEEIQYKHFIEQRIKRIPLQHLTKEQEFMGLSFEVNENVLIPRQDTEILVESVLEHLDGSENILDVCTGSGCILISLLKHLKGGTGIGIDISEKALEVAKRNAEIHEVDATFIQSDLFEHVEGVYDVIVSNPPYIKTKEIEDLEEEVKLHDPLLALDGKEDGLYFYRKIIKESKKYLRRNGMLYFEIGNTQGEEVKRLMEESGFVNVKIKKDLAGLDRVVYGV